MSFFRETNRLSAFLLAEAVAMAALHSKVPVISVQNISPKFLRQETTKMYYDMEKSGKRIRQLRIESGLTQEKAAEALNVDRSFYSRIESGKKGCSVDLFIQLSELFQVSLDYLVLGRYPGVLPQRADAVRLKKDIAALVTHLEQIQTAL